MIAKRQIKKVINNKVTLDIPENFGDEVEVIILSCKGAVYGKKSSVSDEEKRNKPAEDIWESFTVQEFLSGYNEQDSIYDCIEK